MADVTRPNGEKRFHKKLYPSEAFAKATQSSRDEDCKQEITGCRKRKQFQPQRSLPLHDPYFRGAYVSMRTIVTNMMTSRLEMSCYFKPPEGTTCIRGINRGKRVADNGNRSTSQLISDRRYRRNFKRCQRRKSKCSEKMSRNSVESPGDEEEATQPESDIPYEKQCASCRAKKTPLWRDAEDGTPLCNACGIRYKKYKIRCAKCWHIPKKDEFSPTCKSCGSGFLFAASKNWQ